MPHLGYFHLSGPVSPCVKWICEAPPAEPLRPVWATHAPWSRAAISERGPSSLPLAAPAWQALPCSTCRHCSGRKPAEGCAGLRGCRVSLHRTRSAGLSGVHGPTGCGGEIRKASARTAARWRLHPFFFFGPFLLPLTWVSWSLEVTALIQPRDQQQEADLLWENGKLFKRHRGGGPLPEAASHPQAG